MQVLHIPRSWLALASILAVGIPLGVRASAETRLTKQDATRFESKLASITHYALLPARTQHAQTTEVTDAEVNSFLKFSQNVQIPVGIVQPTINALGNGRVSG